jgi:inner membrane protein
MSPITHLLASWVVAAKTTDNVRDRRLVTLAGILPDADGLGVFVDMITRSGGHPGTQLYWQYHHYLLHGLAAGLLISTGLCLFARKRLRVLFLGLCVFHLHLVCDFVGSRGPSLDDLWPIYYLGPLTRDPRWVWRGQWALDAWPNRVISATLFLWSLGLAVKLGDSFVGVFNRRIDAVFVGALRNWQTQFARRYPKAEAFLLTRTSALLLAGLLLMSGLIYQAHVSRANAALAAGIAENLRQIESAKRAWASAHQVSGQAKLSEKDVTPYLPAQSQSGFRPLAGERYFIGKLTDSPEALLTSDLGNYPRGTLIRLRTNGEAVIRVPGRR